MIRTGSYSKTMMAMWLRMKNGRCRSYLLFTNPIQFTEEREMPCDHDQVRATHLGCEVNYTLRLMERYSINHPVMKMVNDTGKWDFVIVIYILQLFTDSTIKVKSEDPKYDASFYLETSIYNNWILTSTDFRIIKSFPQDHRFEYTYNLDVSNKILSHHNFPSGLPVGRVVWSADKLNQPLPTQILLTTCSNVSSIAISTWFCHQVILEINH